MRIGIIGAGPLGIEAALYARFLGYEVTLFTRSTVCSALLQKPDARLEEVAGRGMTPLGVAALTGQDPGYRAVEPEKFLTGPQWLAQYFGPLAESDLVADSIRLDCEVVAVRAAPISCGAPADFAESGVSPLDDEQEADDFDDEESFEDDDAFAEDDFDGDAASDDAASDDDFGKGESDDESADARFERVMAARGKPIEVSFQSREEGASGEVKSEKFDRVIDATGAARSFAVDMPPGYDTFAVLGPRGPLADSVTPASFGIHHGHDQIRQLFAIIGERAGLDLYRTIKIA